MLTKEQKAAFIKALRSGHYAQTRGVLVDEGGDGECSYCVLGVMAEAVFRLPNHGNHFLYEQKRLYGELPPSLLSIELQEELIDLNDDKEMSFPKIADWAEKNLPTKEEEMQ